MMYSLATAKKIGIRPISTREEAEEMKDRLIEIAACERYGLDSLTHSIPYLIPQASALLDTIELISWIHWKTKD